MPNISVVSADPGGKISGAEQLLYDVHMSRFLFQHVIVLFNPASTHAAQAKKKIAELRALVPSDTFLLLETSNKGRAANKKLLLGYSHLLGAQTLLCIAAGDGTVNMAVEVLASCTGNSTDPSKTVILPLWGGNANDVAHMLNGPAYRISLQALLTRGQIVTVRPLCCTLTDSTGNQRRHLAIGYISFGATALAARRLNEPPHRTSRLHSIPGGRILQELLTVLQALRKAPAFKIEDKGKERSIYDRMFINGSRIGKIRSLPLSLADNAYYKTTLSEKRLGAALARIRELLRRPSVEKTAHPTVFRCIDKAWAQLDGETIRIAPGTLVEVGHSTNSFRALSVRLPADNK